MTSRAGRFTGRRASNLTTPTRESSVEPDRRRSFGADFRKPGLLHPPLSAATLPQPAPFHVRYQPPTRTFRVRLAAAERDAHCTVRAAETAARNSKSSSGTGLLLKRKTTGTARTEAFAFRLILALALGGAILGLAGLPPLVSGLKSLAAFVRQWVG